uniref:C-type lectin domain-containing protein n=1 Tax=Amphiprion percula TaxID=161767 RepID=A0A3P8RX42_AMPPE
FLCLLLVAGLITRTYLYQLQTSYNNLVEEKDQLQTRYNNLVEEKDQLQTRYNNLVEEKDQLQTRYNNDHFQKGWVHFNHSFYYISSVKKNWNESRNDCLQRGADIAFLLITDFLCKSFTERLPDRIWIGLKYNESTEWKWVDETPLTQCYWLHGEPNGVEKDEHCVEIKRNNADKGWNDAPCTVTKTWICEKKVAL